MNLTNKNTIYLSATFIAIMTVVVFNLVNFTFITGAITDENIYIDSPSNLYLVDTISGYFIEKDSIDNLNGNALILSINGVRTKNYNDYNLALANVNQNDSVTLTLWTLYPLNDESSKFITTKRNIVKNAVLDIGNNLLIRNVTSGGASDRAGLRPGDIIVSINQKRFENAISAHKELQSMTPGSIISYQVIRNNEPREFNVKLAKFGIDIFYLALLISGLLTSFVGFFFAVKRYKLKAARLAGWSLIALGFFISFCLVNSLGSSSFLQTSRLIFSVLWINFGLPLLIHSFFYFPVEATPLIEKKYILRTLYGIGFLLFISAAVLLYFNEGRIATIILNASILVYVLYNIIIRIVYRKLLKHYDHRLARAITLTIYSLIVIAIINIIAISYFKIDNIQYFFPFFLVLLPLSYIYTVARYRLFDLDIRIKRNIQYTFFSFLLRTIFVFIFFGLIYILAKFNGYTPNLHFTGSSIELLDRPLRSEMQSIYDKILLIIAAIFISWVLYKIGKSLQRLLDAVYYRSKFDYQSLASELSEGMAEKQTMSELSELISEKIHNLMKLKKTGVIFFRDSDKGIIQNYNGFDSQVFKEFCLAIYSTLYKSVSEFNGSFRVEYLPNSIKNIFEEYSFSYITPIRSKNKLVGCIFIGDKLSESVFTNDDLKFLTTVSHQAAVAIENSILYENLANRERIKHELDIARRIQLASLPNQVPEIKGLDISGISMPALEVGGDYFDYLVHSDTKLTVVVGDVSGKGTSAALYMSKIQGIIRALHEFNLSPKDLLIRTNNLIFNYLEKSSFITAIACLFDNDKKVITIARAGHHPLYHYQATTRQVHRIVPKGLVLGMSLGNLFDRNLEEVSKNYESGDIFIFVTDGIVEARNPQGEEYEEEKLINIIKTKSYLSSEEIRNIIVNSVQEFAENLEQFDDLSVVVVKID